MKNSLRFDEHQLLWFDELNPDFYVKIVLQKVGQDRLNEAGSCAAQTLQLSELPSLISKNNYKNIWRSWEIFEDSETSVSLGPIPLYIDIDDESNPPNLENAYFLTTVCLEVLEQKLYIKPSNSLRVIFSGRKGFHIELRPVVPVDGEQVRKELIAACKTRGLKRRFGNIFLENTVIDTLSHQWLRIPNTFYSWYSADGSLCIRRILPMTVSQFRHLGLERIIQKVKTG